MLTRADRIPAVHADRLRDWILVAALTLAVLAAGIALHFEIKWRSWAGIVFFSASLLAMSCFYRFVRRIDDGRIDGTLHELGILAAYAPAVAALSFIVVTPALPLIDARLSEIDHALGFDWPGWYHAVAAHPILQKLLALLYASSLLHIVVMLIATGLTGRADRARELNTLLLATSLAMVLISGLAPALSAWVHYGIGLDKAYHLDRVLGLRNGTLRVLDVGTLAGIVTFPSFHTAIALILVWVSRGISWLFWPTLAINIGVLASIPSEGGHYFVDVVAGALVTAAAIALMAHGRHTRPVPVVLAGRAGG